MEIKKPQLTEKGSELVEKLLDTRKRELELISDLTEQQLIGPAMRITEPPIWELGHVGWFQDRWILQHLDNQKPSDEKADSLYDSFNIPNVERWDLLFPSRGQTVEYITDILEQIIVRLKDHDPTDEEVYFYRLVLNHEDMHIETLHHIRHTLAYSPPTLSDSSNSKFAPEIGLNYETHDVEIPGGIFKLGATPDLPFVFDNEKWAHDVEVKPFKISSTPVTFAEYQRFVGEGGYEDPSIWTEEGWTWKQEHDISHPEYWMKDFAGQWLWRWFDQWLKIDPHLPIVNINWFEANAYCEWADRRLPTEAEWELAASSFPSPDGEGFSDEKRMYPWGDQIPTRQHANINSIQGGLVDVRAYPEGDSGFGLRQMIGNVWEWTADTFNPYPGYVIDPYDTYSEPSFGQQKVLRGGCWATRPDVIRNTFRNFYTPDRNNVFAGFRTVKK